MRISHLIFAGLAACTVTATAHAETIHSFGTDVIRQFDKNQDEDGLVNLFYQASVGRRSALILGAAQGDERRIYDIAWKRYNDKYLNGSFFQFGATYWDGREEAIESKFGGEARVGYEWPIATWATLSGSVSATYGPEHPSTGDQDVIFLPHLSIMANF